MTDMKFDLRAKAISVVLTNAKGTSEKYELREMDAETRDRYLSGLSKRMDRDNEGNSRIKNFTGFQADLLTLCLFREDGRNIPVLEIQKWPASVVGQIFKEAQKINLLSGEEEISEIKND